MPSKILVATVIALSALATSALAQSAPAPAALRTIDPKMTVGELLAVVPLARCVKDKKTGEIKCVSGHSASPEVEILLRKMDQE